MFARKFFRGFSLIEVLIGTAIFVLFAVGIYSGIAFLMKVVYQSRVQILETAALSEELDIVRNIPYGDVGTVGGVPSGVLPATKFIYRNGMTYTVNTTVRNIDDPFDGTLGGNPNDTAPADYKLVEMSIICNYCSQKKPLTLSTVVGPKNLEGSSNNGALFIHVFDVNGLPVVGANVHVVNAATNPDTIIDDVTDNAGYLRIVDAPTGTLSYSISVSKAGHSSDGTVVASPENPNPVKPPANVVSQTVTEVSFQIDRTGEIVFHTVNPSCAAIPTVGFTLRGNKPIGLDPIVYKYNNTLSTDGGGNKTLPAMEPDTYYFGLSGTTYDVAGSAPQLPFKLDPGSNQDVTVVLKPHTTNSLLVQARDAGTGLPLSDATVQLSATGYDETMLTGLGYARQTDWSGDDGQVNFLDEEDYWSDDGGLRLNNPEGDMKLKKVGNSYLPSGWLESSTFDMSQGVDFKNVIIEPLAQPPQSGPNSLRIQIATSNSSTPSSWNFIGPDGTSVTYYMPQSTVVHDSHDGNRYLRYRVFLSTANTDYTPQLSELAFTYTNSCTPPGQAFFNGLNAGTYNLSVTRLGYVATTSTIDIAGNAETTVNMSPP